MGTFKPFSMLSPFSTITMQPQENPARVLMVLHGKSTKGFLLKNQYCLECRRETRCAATTYQIYSRADMVNFFLPGAVTVQ